MTEVCKLEMEKKQTGESHDLSSKAFNFISGFSMSSLPLCPSSLVPHFPAGASDRNSLRNKRTRSLKNFPQTMITLVKKQDPCQYDPLDALEDKKYANPSPSFLDVVEDGGCVGASRAMSQGHGPAQSSPMRAECSMRSR